MNKQIEEMANIIHDADMKIILDMLKPTPDDFVGRALPRQVYIAKALHKEGYRKASDVAREVFEEIEKRLAMYSHLHKYAEDAHKVTEEYADGSPVEMTSVWDACRLEHNGYDDYETMCQLQDNIGNIEKSRLLKEFECDIAQLKKKYESEGAE